MLPFKPFTLTKILFLLCLSFFAYAEIDSTKSPIVIHGNLQLTNNGISPVPSFSLGKPALLTTLIVSKGRFSFNPEFNFDLEAKPWSVNTWVKYKLIQRGRFDFILGNNFSLFFKRNLPNPRNEEFQLQRYQAFEFNAGFQLTSKRSLRLMYWKSQSLDGLGIKNGLFVMLVAQINDAYTGKLGRISFRPSAFVIDNTAPFTAYFISQITTFYPAKFPLNLSFQTVHPLYSSPNSPFNWNLGLNLPF